MFEPKEQLTNEEVQYGLKQIIRNGIANQAMGTLIGGVFLVAYALKLGASNFVIGLLAALPPLIQVLQIPAIYLIEKIRKRKLICVVSCLISRSCLLIMAGVPLIIAGQGGLAFLFIGLFFYTAFAAVSGCSWNTWMRDLIPENMLGSFFSKRMALSMTLGIVLSFLAGFYLDYMPKYFGENEAYGYAFLFAAGFVLGMVETYFLAKIPEPIMPPVQERRNFFKVLGQPFKDANFRQLLVFLGSWNFAVNLAVPFFTVYMLKRLGLSMSVVIGLSIVTQIFNVLFFKLWGKFSDRFSNKSVLGASGPMYMLCILAWAFTTMPEKYFLTYPLLIALHIFMGISTAGINLASGNIGLKLAPKGQATAYLAANNLTNSVAASIAPVLGGKFADFFAERSLQWTLTWQSPGKELVFQTLDFRHWDFFFFLAFVIGQYSLHRLSFIQEFGEVEEEVVIDELMAEVTKPLSMFYKITGVHKIVKVTKRMKRKVFNNSGQNHEKE
jgi:MFS family permease